MSYLLLYLLKVSLGNLAMLAVYRIVVESSRNFGLMRGFLLASVLLPLLFPFIPDVLAALQPASVELYRIVLPEVVITPAVVPAASSVGYPVWFLVWMAGVGLMGFTFLYSLGRIWVLTRTSPKKDDVFLTWNPSGFSFFSLIFLSSDTLFGQDSLILIHERQHARLLHSADRLLVSVFRTFFWFTPGAHVAQQLLAEVHEFQADELTVQEVAKRENIVYSELLLSTPIQANRIQLVSSFSYQLKKRIRMLKDNSPRFLDKRKLITSSLVLLVLLFMISCAQSGEKKSQTEIAVEEVTEQPVTPPAEEPAPEPVYEGKILTIVEKQPTFKGGDEARIKWLSENISYPEDAKQAGKAGTVYLTFVVEPDGKITNVEMLRGVYPSIDAEAMRATEKMPEWEPGYYEGKAVRTQFSMPIKFTLAK